MKLILRLTIFGFFMNIITAQNIIPSKDQVMNFAYATAKKENKNVFFGRGNQVWRIFFYHLE